jgi:hypothetical protein
MDGEPPFFERYSINSASVVFRDWDYFPDPNIARNESKEFILQEQRKNDFKIEGKILPKQDQTDASK